MTDDARPEKTPRPPRILPLTDEGAKEFIDLFRCSCCRKPAINVNAVSNETEVAPE